MFFFSKKKTKQVDPHEVLLDSQNLPSYNTWQFEGRFETPINQWTLIIVMGLFVIVGSAAVVRLGFLQLVEGSEFAERSEQNRLDYRLIFAERGVIYDRRGEELAWNAPNDEDVYTLREYTATSGFAHLLGYTALPRRDTSGFFHRTQVEGVAGVEEFYQERLTGENGLRIVETNALGDVWSEGTQKPPEDGESLTLTVDARLQAALHSFLRERSEAGTFQAGAGVIMDIHTGDVLALTSYPEFKPTAMTYATSSATIQAFQSDPRKVFLNRVAHGLYTPGSVVKPMMAMAALQEEIISPRKQIFSSGQLVVPNPYTPSQPTIFKDWRAHGNVDMRRAIAVSSNVYFFHIGGGFEGQEGLGITRIEQYMREFGLAEPTGSILDPDPLGVIPTPEWKEETFGESVWRVGDTYNTSIGQYGFLVTPLQLVRATAALATKGTLVRPRLVVDEEVEQTQLPIEEEYFEIAHDGMRQAVLEGTTQALNFPWVEVAGKTGTAEVGVHKEFVNSVVMGFFPYEEPKYAFVVVMERGPAGTLQGAPYVMYQMFRWMHENTPEYLETAL